MAAEVADVVVLSLKDIVVDPDRNPRGRGPFRKIDELAAMLLEKGQLHPLIVRPHPTMEGKFLLIAGARRYQAALKLGWTTLEAKVKHVDDLNAAFIALMENGGREDIDPFLEAEEWHRIIKTYDISQAELARRLGISEATVSTRLKALRDSTEELRAASHKGEVQFSLVRDLCTLPPTIQREMVAAIRKNNAAGIKTNAADLRRTIEDKKHEQAQHKCGSLLAKDEDFAAKVDEVRRRAQLRPAKELVDQWGATFAKLGRTKTDKTSYKLSVQLDAIEWALRIRDSL